MRIRCMLATLALAVGISAVAEPTPLVIISPHGEDVKTEFARAFEAWHERKFGQRVQVSWRDVGGTNDDLRFVLNEFKSKPDGIGLDIFFGGGDYPFVELADKKLLAPYRPPPEILDPLARDIGGVKMYDAENFTWYGAATAGFGIAFNKRVLRAKGWPEPKTWADLTDPRYQGWISSGDPRHSGSTHMMYELILQAYGWERGWAIIYQMGANARSFEKSSANAVKECTLGNAAYSLAIDFYAYSQIAFVGEENMGWIMPEEIAVMNPDGIAILKGAPQREAAKRFLDFVLGEEGQKLWFLPRGHPEGAQRFIINRMSLRRDFYDRYRGVSPVRVNPFVLTTVQYDPKKGSARQKLVDALIGATVIDTHDEAVAAWKAAASASSQARDEFSAVPMKEDEAMKIAVEKWKDSDFRNRQTSEWQRWAIQKYTASNR